MSKFFDYVEELPVLFQELIKLPSYKIENLTEGQMKEKLGQSEPTKGVYIMYDKNTPMYVGSSKTLAQKIGEDERAKDKSTISKKIFDFDQNILSIDVARNHLFENYTVKFMRIDDDILRAIFVIYLVTKLETPFNSFMES